MPPITAGSEVQVLKANGRESIVIDTATGRTCALPVTWLLPKSVYTRRERVEMPRTLLRPKSKAKSKLKSQASASPVEAVEAAARVAVDSKGSCLASDPQHQEFLDYLARNRP